MGGVGRGGAPVGVEVLLEQLGDVGLVGEDVARDVRAEEEPD